MYVSMEQSVYYKPLCLTSLDSTLNLHVYQPYQLHVYTHTVHMLSPSLSITSATLPPSHSHTWYMYVDLTLPLSTALPPHSCSCCLINSSSQCILGEPVKL